MATVTVRGRAAADVEPDRVRLVLAVQADAVHATLRAAAVRDARARARDYAGAADLRLGALEWITEPDLRPGEPGWVPLAATFSTAVGSGGGPVLELRPEPVA